MRRRRYIARFLLLVMSMNVMAPSAMALTSGPSAPEVGGFTPIGNSDMVNLFSGDFSYNIPLLDVEGYPINLSYSAGATMDQEASWVGLGWSLNPGVVERHLRGIPDDFAGDIVRREMNLKKNMTVGVQTGFGLELFGVDPGDAGTSLSLNFTMSPEFNNYDGVSFATGVNMGLRSTRTSGSSFTANLGMTSTSNSGLRLQPEFGVESKWSKPDRDLAGSLNFGIGMNSRQGFTNTSFGLTAKRTNYSTTGTKGAKDYKRSGRSGISGGASFGSSYDLGQPTYSPQIPVPMSSMNFSARITMGGQAAGAHIHGSIGGSYAEQTVRNKSMAIPSFGYLYLGAGQLADGAQLDMNREKDGPFSKDKHALPIPTLTNDIFAVSGQNIGGSFRAFRDDAGYVFDPTAVSTSNGGSLGGEVGFAVTAHIGVDANVNSANTQTGVWRDDNTAAASMGFRGTAGHPLDEHVYFRDAGEAVVEQDPALYGSYGGDQPAKFTMTGSGAYDMRLENRLDVPGPADVIVGATQKTKRDARGQVFSYLTHKEVVGGMGLMPQVDRAGTPMENKVRPHHMSEITVLTTDGSRNVYGLPAYNIEQNDVTFALGSQQVNAVLEDDELVPYNSTDASTGNQNGKDNYYSESTTPAYPYAFYLTAALSHDYSDVDGVAGPSPGDLGHYTKFDYAQGEMDFPWRTPSDGTAFRARADEGLGAVDHDDKASYVFGRKELWYVKTIESRNLVAEFETSEREDAMGISENGALPTIPKKQRKLDKISLYEKTAYDAWQAGGSQPVPIKSVHFTYATNYPLCPDMPNSTYGDEGKLTLTQVHFTYGNSYRGVTSPYKFHYHGALNPSYALGASDRWGNYKPIPDPTPLTPGLRNHEFPYAEQNKTVADANVKVWNLERIELPSGGEINVDYESDDYAYVQNRRAQCMYIVDNVEILGNGTLPSVPVFQPTQQNPYPETDNALNGESIYLSIRAADGQAFTANSAQHLFDGLGGQFYFRLKMKLHLKDGMEERWDYVSGYGKLDPGFVQLDGVHAYIRVLPVDLDENSGDARTPFFRSAMEHARRFYPTELFNPDEMSDNQNDPLNLMLAMLQSINQFTTGWKDYLTGPNKEAFEEIPGGGNDGASHMGQVQWGESYVRLAEVTGFKLGGGHRVRELRFKDAWDQMSGLAPREYGQHYDYTTLETGSALPISSGVAAWEPNAGADENCWRWPAYGTSNVAVFPKDERFYQEEPFGESMFPGASVGYSKVTVTDVYPQGFASANQGTGSVVNEFYTAKDYPTITGMTGIDVQRKRSNFDVLSILGLKASDHNHVSQGFTVETNDMHGKPKRTTVYAEPSGVGPPQPVSWVAYQYQDVAYGNSRRLTNDAKTIAPDGTVATATIGRNYEVYADMRKFNSKSKSGGMAVNTEMLIPPVTIPILMFNASSESKIHKSAVLVKKIDRFGILQRVEKMENGSVVSTENVAYDALTGQVLVTKTINDFEDPVYSMTFPAYWHYDGMGPAFRNIGAVKGGCGFNNGTHTMANANSVFSEGDELILTANGAMVRAWVDDVQPGSIHIIDALGNAMGGTYHVKVVRSGRRNMQTVPMTTLALLSDPLQGLSGNVFSNILNAQVVELKDRWRTQCPCVDVGQLTSDNPYRMNTKGVWRLNKEHAWLTERTRSHYNNNTNIRRDGVFATFDPFYKVDNGIWERDSAGWTMVREVTEYGALGQELENRDALGLYSSATFGHNGTLPKTVARNARYVQQGFEGFEEPVPVLCTDQHFRIPADPANITTSTAHTGRKSVRVVAGAPLSMTTPLPIPCPPEACDLALAVTGAGSAPRVVTASGGTPAYQFAPVIISGAPTISLTANGLSIAGVVAGTSVQVIASDADGCSTMITVVP